jgi:hypothetical protein
LGGIVFHVIIIMIMIRSVGSTSREILTDLDGRISCIGSFQTQLVMTMNTTGRIDECRNVGLIDNGWIAIRIYTTIN